MRIANSILAKNGQRGFKKLTAVITAPTLRIDGSVLDLPGYDEASGIFYYASGEAAIQVPHDPPIEWALRALDELWKPFSKFPFVDSISRGVLLQAIITACLRGSLPTAPCTGFDAPAAGTGKSLLARCVAFLSTGSDPAILPPADTDEETRKRLFAALRDGSRVLLWDNVREPLGCASLDAFLTAANFTDRVLGVSATESLPNRALFLVTGNNLRLTGDTSRRILIARLDAQIERADRREFDFDPIQWIKSKRDYFVACALIIVRAWITAGRPHTVKGKMASFEDWDELVRQPLCWLKAEIERLQWQAYFPSFADPYEAVTSSFEQDPETSKLAGLLRAWHGAFKNVPTTVASALEPAGPEYESLRAAFEEISPMVQNKFNPRVLGRWIQSRCGRCWVV